MEEKHKYAQINEKTSKRYYKEIDKANKIIYFLLGLIVVMLIILVYLVITSTTEEKIGKEEVKEKAIYDLQLLLDGKEEEYIKGCSDNCRNVTSNKDMSHNKLRKTTNIHYTGLKVDEVYNLSNITVYDCNDILNEWKLNSSFDGHADEILWNTKTYLVFIPHLTKQYPYGGYFAIYRYEKGEWICVACD